MAELWFYHLARTSLEEVLPGLLEKTLERGWKAVVRVGNEARLEALDSHLWTYDEAAFLPHGRAGDGQGADQPVYLTAGEEVPNKADLLFLVDGAPIPDPGGDTITQFERCILIFDGRDETALASAREAWRAAKDAGIDVSYWQQGARGWEKKT